MLTVGEGVYPLTVGEGVYPLTVDPWQDREASPRVYERWTPWRQDEAGRWTRECPELGCLEVLPLGVRPGEWYWGSWAASRCCRWACGPANGTGGAKMAKFTPLEQRTLQVAKRYVGLKEATGRNDGEQIRFWQRWVANGKAWLDGQPWCACFGTWSIHRAHNELRREGYLMEPLLTPKNASSSGLYRWYKRNGKLLTKPKPGCVGLVKGGPTGHSHTFLVHDVQDGEVVGVDGNYRNGVRWSRRPISDCDYGEIC